jgi:hypothetical protein
VIPSHMGSKKSKSTVRQAWQSLILSQLSKRPSTKDLYLSSTCITAVSMGNYR